MFGKKQDKRFEVVHTEYTLQIIRDKETGVNYLLSCAANAGGLTVLLDKDGKPMITPSEK